MSSNRLNLSQDGILEKVHKGLEVVGIGLLLAVGLSVTLRIIARQVDFLPDLLWTGEISRYALVLMTIIGVPYAMWTNDHISIRPLMETLAERYQTVLFIMTNVLIVLFCLFLALSSYVVAGRTLSNPLPTVRWLNYGYVNITMTLMFLLTAVFTLDNTVKLWRQFRSGDQPSEETEVAT